MCIEFPGPTHRPTERNDRSTIQLDAFAVPASAIWKGLPLHAGRTANPTTQPLSPRYIDDALPTAE